MTPTAFGSNLFASLRIGGSTTHSLGQKVKFSGPDDSVCLSLVERRGNTRKLAVGKEKERERKKEKDHLLFGYKNCERQHTGETSKIPKARQQNQTVKKIKCLKIHLLLEADVERRVTQTFFKNMYAYLSG